MSARTDLYYFQYLAIPVQAVLSWMMVRWIASNLARTASSCRSAFNGSAIGYIGWHLLMYVSVITIIGWAWVITAWMRWNCRNIEGTRREVIFNGTAWKCCGARSCS